MFKSSWGFHPCDKETYLKLKKLNYYHHLNKQRKSSLVRWSRKEPQNRLLRRWLFDEQGRKCVCEIIGPKPEPKICPLPLEELSKEFHKVRMPKILEKDVLPLRYSVEMICKFLKAAEEFFNVVL